MIRDAKPARLLSQAWPGRLAVRVSRDLDALDLHAYLWERGQREGAEVVRFGGYYLVPDSWLPDLLRLFLSHPQRGGELTIRRPNGERAEVRPLIRPGLALTCGRGHPFTRENTYVSPTGRRRCRACKKIWKER